MTASCPDCKVGFILPGEPTGALVSTYGPTAYLASAGGEQPSSRAIILLTDIFGLPLKNSKILADRYSKELNCDVWVPDEFNGSPPFKPTELSEIPEIPRQNVGFFKTLKLWLTILSRTPALIRNRPGVVDKRIDTFIGKLQADKKYAKLGAIGYCYGGGVASRLATKDLVQSAVICHPSPVSESVAKAIKIPTAWSCAEEDMSFPDKSRVATEAILAARKGKDNFIDYEFKVFKGTTHGFAARPNMSYPEVKEGFEGAVKQAVDWFNKTIPA